MELTKMVNTILRGRGDSLEVSPETVGRTLKAIGLRSQFIAGGRHSPLRCQNWMLGGLALSAPCVPVPITGIDSVPIRGG
jgi:hypothetical protein